MAMLRKAETYRNHFNALSCQRLSSWFGHITSNTTNLVLLGQDGICENSLDDRTTLVASGAKDCEKLGHAGQIRPIGRFYCVCSVCVICVRVSEGR